MDDRPPTRRSPEELWGRYTDPASVGSILVVGFVMLVWSTVLLMAGALANPALTIFMLLVLLAGLVALTRALIAATLEFDLVGWSYRRTIFGLTIEAEWGSWADIARTTYRQGISQGS